MWPNPSVCVEKCPDMTWEWEEGKVIMRIEHSTKRQERKGEGRVHYVNDALDEAHCTLCVKPFRTLEIKKLPK